ncbi:hypothetical protein NDU88_004241 [Pleurodeles waltl]|uniref:Uncharacterized protein n=1 Tax=Pleurodeles waltl TaxID=8319 RepID=A0AAV7N0X0_PLEWA|nr:hypothetical protein NDU88_004241 [Pleurodeles waltl]
MPRRGGGGHGAIATQPEELTETPKVEVAGIEGIKTAECPGETFEKSSLGSTEDVWVTRTTKGEAEQSDAVKAAPVQRVTTNEEESQKAETHTEEGRERASRKKTTGSRADEGREQQGQEQDACICQVPGGTRLSQVRS